MTKCCTICMKKFCEIRDTIENCKNCISEVYLQFMQIDKKLEEVNEPRKNEQFKE